jgi:hypothetical protein
MAGSSDEVGAIGVSTEDEVSSETDIAGSSDDEGAADDEDSEDDDGASEEDGAADDDEEADDDDELTSEEVATGVTGVGVGRLKMKMRPTITATATMMMIQVLRFIACMPLFGGGDREVCFYVDASPLPEPAASKMSSVVGGVQFRRSLGLFFARSAAA